MAAFYFFVFLFFSFLVSLFNWHFPEKHLKCIIQQVTERTVQDHRVTAKDKQYDLCHIFTMSACWCVGFSAGITQKLLNGFP